MSILSFVVFLLVLCEVSFYRSNNVLDVTYYELPTQVTENVRIVHLSDLHCASFGEGNCRLIELIKSQQPDLIFCTGDLVNLYEEDAAVAVEFLTAIKDIAPVYYSPGNHEKQLFP